MPGKPKRKVMFQMETLRDSYKQRMNYFCKLWEKSDLEGKKTKKLYDKVLHTEDTFVKDVNELIAYQQLLEYRKKEILHKKWSDEVYEPVRLEVVKEINGPAYIQLDRRKRELHKDYLRHTNKKGHVFLDTIDTNEYNPLGLHDNRPHIVKGMQAEVRPLNDPLLSQERDRANEERTILRCLTGINFTDKDINQIRLPPVPLVPLGRHGTDSRTWLEMPMADIESPVRHASRRRMKEASNGSQIDFGRWSSSPLTGTLVNEDLQSRKTRMYVVHPPYTLGQSQTLIESPAKNSLIAHSRSINAVHACSA